MASVFDKLKAIIQERRASPPPIVNLREHKARAATMRLRTYQVTGVEFLRTKKRAMLADAPGVGKTFQATEAATLPAIITCPSLLHKQWQNFLLEQYPGDPVYNAASGDVLERNEALEGFKSEGGWLIVNHDLWRRFAMPPASTLIVDESHHFKNREAKRSVQLRTYAHKVPEFVYLLTATPVHKDVSDLWHQLHLLDPTTWSSYWRFIDTYAVTINYGYSTKVLKVRDQASLNKAIAPYVLERTAKQVRLEMPQAVPKHVELTLDSDTRKVYNRLRDFYRYEKDGKDEVLTNAGAVLHALRRVLVNNVKVNALAEIIDDTPDDGHPIYVFTAYKSTAHYLTSHFNDTLSHRYGHAIAITGDIADPDVRRRVALEGGPNKARLRFCTADSITEGIDASHSRTVIWFEETYIPGKKYQVLSRVLRHRIDDDNFEPVVIHHIRFTATVDQVIHNTVSSRTKGNALSVLREALEQAA